MLQSVGCPLLSSGAFSEEPSRGGFTLGPGSLAGGHYRAAEEDIAHAAGALQIQARVRSHRRHRGCSPRNR